MRCFFECRPVLGPPLIIIDLQLDLVFCEVRLLVSGEETKNDMAHGTGSLQIKIPHCLLLHDIPVILGKKGRYAYIYDSTVLEYVTRNEPCTTRVLGQLFKKSGYGIGLRKNSPHLELFDRTILELRESGKLEALENRWITGSCPDPDAGNYLLFICIDRLSDRSIRTCYSSYKYMCVCVCVCVCTRFYQEHIHSQ